MSISENISFRILAQFYLRAFDVSGDVAVIRIRKRFGRQYNMRPIDDVPLE